jgi:hypothetical protein
MKNKYIIIAAFIIILPGFLFSGSQPVNKKEIIHKHGLNFNKHENAPQGMILSFN